MKKNIPQAELTNANLTIALACVILSFVFGFHLLTALSGIIIYCVLLNFQPVMKIVHQVFKGIEFFGQTLLKVILLLVFYVFVLPYGLIVKLFQKKVHEKNTWVPGEFNYADKKYFKFPW